MGDLGLNLLIGTPLFLLQIWLIFYFWKKTWRKKCTTPNRRRLFVAGWTIIIIGMIYLLPPPKLSPLLELDELETATGTLQFHSESRGKRTIEYFTLDGKPYRYHFLLCDYTERVRNRLRGKKVTLWHFDHDVYQAATSEKIVYPLSNVQRRIFWTNITYIFSYLLIYINTIILCLSMSLAGKNDEDKPEQDTFSTLEKNERPKQDEKSLDFHQPLHENSQSAYACPKGLASRRRLDFLGFHSKTFSQHRLLAILLLLGIAWLCSHALMSDTYASHLRLAKLTSYEHIAYPSDWAGSYEDMMNHLEQALQLASTEEERKEVSHAWKRELSKVLSQFKEEELPNSKEREAYFTGERACAKLVQYIKESKDIYLLTDDEIHYQKDLSFFLTLQSRYLLAMENWQKSEELATQAIAYDQDYFYSNAIRAYAIWKQNRPAEALESINKAIELDPKDAYSYELRSSIHKALGNKKAAKEDEKKRKELESKTQNRKRDS